MKHIIIRIGGVLPILLVLFLLVSCKTKNGGDVTTRLEKHLIETTRNTCAISDNIDIFAKSTRTDDPNRIRIDVYLSALGETSAAIPFEAWGDGKQWNFKCLASNDVIDKNNKAFLERINSIKRASSRGNTKWDGVWTGPSWTIELNSKTDEAIVNGESSFWQDGGKYAVIAASGKSVLYMREDGRLFTGDNKGNISVDFGFSLKKQDLTLPSAYPNTSYYSEDTPQTETILEEEGLGEVIEEDGLGDWIDDDEPEPDSIEGGVFTGALVNREKNKSYRIIMALEDSDSSGKVRGYYRYLSQPEDRTISLEGVVSIYDDGIYHYALYSTGGTEAFDFKGRKGETLSGSWRQFKNEIDRKNNTNLVTELELQLTVE